MKKVLSLLCLVFALIMIASIPVSASSAYQTYTYSIDGYALYSPDAYTAVKTVDSTYMGLTEKAKDGTVTGTALDNPGDLLCDTEGNCYIADTGNNRIVVLDKYYKLKFTIAAFVNDQGVADELTAPQGVFVTDDTIWVCDTGANRIVKFDRAGKFTGIIEEPESELFDEDSVYKPVAMAVDQYDRLYVVSSTTYQGVIVMTSAGEFTGFIGAQKVVISAWQIIWRRLQTDAQKQLTDQLVSTEFNNVTINSDGFIYVTTSSIDEEAQQGAIKGNSKSGDYAPVKMLNAAGSEIMRRNGFWPPSGEVDVSNKSTDDIKGCSTIIDAACGPENTWSIIDEKRNKIFTYDFDGNLLFAFGDSGNMLGDLQSIEAITYQGTSILILDKTNDNITVYQRTEYGDILLEAIAAENSLDYDYAIQCWEKVLQRNSNFDAAYVGIGQAYERNGRYAEAIKYYQSAYDTTNYSSAYKELRTDWMSHWFLLLLLIIVVIITACVMFNKWVGKVNKKATAVGGKRTFKEELCYGFHVILHPFDGFWDLKHEKRGSVRASLVFIAITVLTFFYQAIGQGYIMNPTSYYFGFWTQLIAVVVPLLLFVLSNWCLTTLFEGEGSFKDIFIAVSYSLLPIVILIVPATILSNFVVTAEASIVTFIGTLAFIWMGILVFFGTQVTHDYTMFKNVLMFLSTILGMVVIMFIAILFTTLLGKLVSLVTNIVTEIQYRI